MQLADGATLGSLRVEARIRVPQPGQGIWAAFWLSPPNFAYGGWPLSGEVRVPGLPLQTCLLWRTPRCAALWSACLSLRGRLLCLMMPLPLLTADRCHGGNQLDEQHHPGSALRGAMCARKPAPLCLAALPRCVWLRCCAGCADHGGFPHQAAPLALADPRRPWLPQTPTTWWTTPPRSSPTRSPTQMASTPMRLTGTATP